MSLSNEERQSIVTLELKKAYETYDEIFLLNMVVFTISCRRWAKRAIIIVFST